MQAPRSSPQAHRAGKRDARVLTHPSSQTGITLSNPVQRAFAGLFYVLALCLLPGPGTAQPDAITFATIDRPPFSFPEDGRSAGFSIDLMNAIAGEIGQRITYIEEPSFKDMLAAVESGAVDGAIANISITAERERMMDFSQPIFASGLRVMVPAEPDTSSLLGVLFNRDLLFFMLGAIGLLALGGMAMWGFERRRQPYFDRSAREALFPSFWWALNLVVNGGFEERVPQSRMGRLFAVILVISSLFVVSIFVARITTAMTVEAINSSIDSLSDLETKRVATTDGSTASAFLNGRGIAHVRVSDLSTLLSDFEAGKFDAVVFDGPILAYFIRTHPEADARLLPQTWQRENYGIALPTGSPLREDINRALLSLRESGKYDTLRARYFGGTP